MSQPPHPPSAGEDPYGRPSYVPSPYGPPGRAWAPAAPAGGGPPENRRRTAVLLGVVGILMVLALGVTGFFLAGRSAPSSAPSATAGRAVRTTTAPLRPYQPRSTSTSIPRATSSPDGLGSDPALDRLARTCFEGEMQACDDLFANAASNSLYEAYGDTCAGRQEPGTDIYCTTAFPGS